MDRHKQTETPLPEKRPGLVLDLTDQVVDSPREQDSGSPETDPVISERARYLATLAVRDTQLEALRSELDQERQLRQNVEDENQRLRYEGEHDYLTDLLNRKGFMQASYKRLSEAPADKKFAVLFIDLDHFKRVNDTHGHAMGDQVLVAIGRCLEQSHQEDIVCRLSGDEFAVLTSAENEEQLDETIARTVTTCRETSSDILELASDPVGVTIGRSTLRTRGDEQAGVLIDQLLKAADNSMYAKKPDRDSQVRRR